MIIISEEVKERLHFNISKCREMLQVVDIKIGVKQCMEKINKDKIPFKDEARLAQQNVGWEKQSSKSIFDSPLDPKSKLSPKIISLEHHNLFNIVNYSLRDQEPIYYDYSAFSKAYQVRNRGVALKPDIIEVEIVIVYIFKSIKNSKTLRQTSEWSLRLNKHNNKYVIIG